MRVLLLGSGGREHALGWKLAESDRVTTLISAPGNPGLAELGPVIPGVDITRPDVVAELAIANGVDLVVVGPEAPLAAGVVDRLTADGIRVFGPTRAAAQLESSKAFAKEVMAAAGVPTAPAHTFTDAGQAAAHLASVPGPYVVKADGLAAGKGVLVTEDLSAARAWARMCIDGRFGDAGSKVVVEDFLDGEEVSVFALCDGTTAMALAPARDYKRLGDGDTGPNTGGMGSFSPPRDLPDELVPWTLDNVVVPVLHEMEHRTIPYFGFLYVGLALTSHGPQVLEFNCRLGDPETQVLMPRLDSDLLDVLWRATEGNLAETAIEWSAAAAVDVVLAAPGYPDQTTPGQTITGATGHDDHTIVFHAATRRTREGLVTSGGRVLNVVGVAESVEMARKRAYERADQIQFEGRQMRRDIAL